MTATYASEWPVPAPALDWTGWTTTCDAGTISNEFRNRVISRINAFRRLAGSPADVALDLGYSDQAQQAALIMAANFQLSHNPPPTWRCWTQVGHDAAGSSNLANYGGLDVVDLYVHDTGTNNTAAGHRWWLLRSPGRRMGVGSTYGANAMYVVDGSYQPRPVREPDGFLAWPPRGFVAYQLATIRWSFMIDGGNYSSATVTMTSNGQQLPVTVEDRGSYSQLVWRPSNMDPNGFNWWWPQPSGDQVIDVTISGVLVNGVSRTFSYSTIVYDPDDPASRYRGTSAPGRSSPSRWAVSAGCRPAPRPSAGPPGRGPDASSTRGQAGGRPDRPGRAGSPRPARSR